MNIRIRLVDKNHVDNTKSDDKLIIRIRLDGGPGSGNWGHAGRPGKLGGSAGGGGKEHRTGTKESGFSSEAKERAKAKKTTKKETKAKSTFESTIETRKKTFTSVDGSNNKSILAENIAGNSKALKKEMKQAIKDGHIDDFIEKHHEEYLERYEKNVKSLSDDKIKAAREQIVELNKESESEILSKCEGKHLSAREYFDLVTSKAETMSAEEYVLEEAYRTGLKAGLGFRAEDLNSKLYNGKDDDLTYNEKRFVDMVESKATALQDGTTLYRGVGIDYLERLTGTSSEDKGFTEKLQALVGNTSTNDGLMSCAPGMAAYFANNSKVICKVTTGKNAKAYVMQNTNEGEFIFPTKSSVKVTNVKIGDAVYPIWDSSTNVAANKRRCPSSGYAQLRTGDNFIAQQQIVVEMEVSYD